MAPKVRATAVVLAEPRHQRNAQSARDGQDLEEGRPAPAAAGAMPSSSDSSVGSHAVTP